MKYQIINLLLVSLIGTFTFLQAKNQDKTKETTFIREYYYNASDIDSKISSRQKAITQLKSLLSEEVGVHIQSNFEIKQTRDNKYVRSEINQLSTSITKLKILEETWNGRIYYVKASVKINEEQTMQLLLEAIKAKASQKDIKRLNKILQEQNNNLDKSYSKIKQLQKKLVLQEIKNLASKDELSNTKIILQKLQEEKQKYDREVIEQNNEIIKIKKLVKKAQKRIKKEHNKACLLQPHMTIHEVTQAIGEPISYRNPVYYYGDVEIWMKNGMVAYIKGCK